MFDELHEHYLKEQAIRMNNKKDNNNNGIIQQEAFAAVTDRIINSADAEITLYREESSLFPLQDAEGNFTCPLKWWHANHRKCKMLSQLAFRILCVPATSAPEPNRFFQLQVSQLPRTVQGWLHKQPIN
jgi:hypothetical protein